MPQSGRTVLLLLVALAAVSCNLYESEESYYPMLKGVTFGDGRYVAVGDDGVIVTSDDGSRWTLRPAGVTNALATVAYCGGRFVAAGRKGDLLWSADGETWTAVVGWDYGFSHVVCCGTEFWATGEDGIVASSPEGVTWQERHTGTPWAWRIACSSTTWVVVEQGGGGILSSTDGDTWTRVDPGVGAHCGLVFGAEVFVAVDPVGNIRTSDDGLAWTVALEAAWTGEGSQCDAAYGGYTFVIVEMMGTVLVSADGVSWQEFEHGHESELGPLAVTYDGSGFTAVGVGSGLTFTCVGGVCTDPKFQRIKIPKPDWLGGGGSADGGSGGEKCNGITCPAGDICVSSRSCIKGAFSCECAGTTVGQCVAPSLLGLSAGAQCGTCGTAYTACCAGTVCVNATCYESAQLPSGCTAQ